MSMARNVADELVRKIIATKAPIVVGLDPALDKIPLLFKVGKSNDFSGVAQTIFEFNRAIIDVVKARVPAVKPQMAFYEMYGSPGVRAFEETVRYAKQCGLIVIEDGKRNDIGNTAQAYAQGHLGEVPVLSGELIPSFDVDFLTVSPFLGPESLEPFFDVTAKMKKGVFVLVKTSNEGSGTIQDVLANNGNSVSEELAVLVNEHAKGYVGECGYSPIGAVVGATYPKDAAALRKLMPKSLILVPGYGTQGAGAADVVPNFHDDGLGAIVNASRSLNFAYQNEYGEDCTLEQFYLATEHAVVKMQREIYAALKASCRNILY